MAAFIPPSARAQEPSGSQSIAGQKIIVGFFGTKATHRGFRQVLENLESGLIGGVLFLGRNISTPDELKEMVRQLNECKCSKPPIIAIDEEGGAVERLGERLGLEDTPSASKVGTRSDKFARGVYHKLALKLADFGFNLDLAPVVDLDVEDANPAIGRLGRSYSTSPNVVVEKAKILVEELRKYGIATSLKHFPGHGSSLTDSHAGPADVENTWSEKELAPYKLLIASNLADSIMVGHLSNARRWGGTASQDGSTAVSDLLRQRLKFNGLVISDDLTMLAAPLSGAALSGAIRSSIRSGIDVVIVTRGTDEDEDFDTGKFSNMAIVAGVKAGEISRTDIDASDRRIVAFKKKFLKRDHQRPRA